MIHFNTHLIIFFEIIWLFHAGFVVPADEDIDFDPQRVLFKEFEEKFMIIEEGIRSASNDLLLAHFVQEEKKFMQSTYTVSEQYLWNDIQDKKLKRFFEIYAVPSPHLLADESHTQIEKIQEDAIQYIRRVVSRFQNTALNKLLSKFQALNEEKLKKLYKSIQEEWQNCSQDLKTNILPYVGNFFKMIREFSRYSSGEGFPHPTSTFWSYMMGYGYDFSFNEIHDIMKDQIRTHINIFNSYMQVELAKALKFRGPTEIGPIPPYLYGIFRDRKFYGKVFQHESLDSLVSQHFRTNRVNIRSLTVAAQDFFLSLQFTALDDQFWNSSIFKTPTRSKTPLIADIFINQQNYWLEINAPSSLETFYSIHRHLLRIHRNLIYQQTNLEWVFREPDFIPFYDALESAVAMSARSANRAIQLGFATEETVTEALLIESLKNEANAVFNTLASALTMDSWSWAVLNEKYDDKYAFKTLWDLRRMYEGVVPVIEGGEGDLSTDANLVFDCASLDHTFPFQLNYLNVTSIVLQYQIFEGLCKKAGEYNPNLADEKPLYKCNIFGNTNVGNFLKDEIIPLGSSIHWKDRLEMITGVMHLDAKPLLNYFRPLFKHIDPRMFSTPLL